MQALPYRRPHTPIGHSKGSITTTSILPHGASFSDFEHSGIIASERRGILAVERNERIRRYLGDNRLDRRIDGPVGV
jgi:hypothetical protein